MILRRTTLLVPLVLLSGCGSSLPPILALTIQAGAEQNPDPAGRPTPVAIRIYQLALLSAFNRADIFGLIDRQADTLGTDCLASDEMIVTPGERRTATLDLKPNTRFIGAAALFRAFDQATWRVAGPAALSGLTHLTLVTSGTRLIASPNRESA
jgi:type VI secretion system protein VasD